MTEMAEEAQFIGVGVGPGEPGLIPVAACEAVKGCDRIMIPRASSAQASVARRCLGDLGVPEERFAEIEFTMDPDRNRLRRHYREVAKTIAAEIDAGNRVAYLTLGDPTTYSTYNYVLEALREERPHLRYRTYPGVPSYCALAAATDRSLGVGKESVVILPCPDDMSVLRETIRTHDNVVVMKIGRRLPEVLRLLKEMEIARHCVLGSRVGMPEEEIATDLTGEACSESKGYMATMLIRKTATEKRHV